MRANDKEVEVLKYLAMLYEEMFVNMPNKNISWLFLGADLYGTRINSLPKSAVDEYFSSLKDWVNEILPLAEFRLWSDFDQQAENYREIIRSNFIAYVSNALLARASETAKAMKRGSSPKDYLVERIAEAMLIENLLSPIKISCVAIHKDHEVDGVLPRLYLLPSHLHASWM